MMVRPRTRLTLGVALVALVAGCGQAEPTLMPAVLSNTPVPPTAAPAATSVPPAETPLFPTAEPSPTAARTAEPSPTATPTADRGAAGDTWFKTYGGRQNDVANDVLRAGDGGFFIVGVTDLEFEPEQQGDVYLIKTNAAGEILWEKTFGGPGYEAGATASPTSDGGLLLSGTTNSPGGGGMDIYLIKVDQDGNELWSRTFGGPLDEVGAAWPLSDDEYILWGNIVDPNDPVVDNPGIAGYAGFAGRSNAYLARIDSGGNELWSRALGGDDNVVASSGVQTPDGGFLVLATIMYFPENDDDIYLVKVDENGNEIWSRTWERGMSSGYDLVQTSDGNYLITGPTSSPADMDRSNRDFLFIKVDPEGNELWTSTFGDPAIIDYAQVLAATTDGGSVAAGGAVGDLTTWDEDMVIVKIDGSGQLLWEQMVDTDAHIMFATVLEHPEGGYIVAGSIFKGRDFDVFVLRTDAQGHVTGTSEPAAITTLAPPTHPAGAPPQASAPTLDAISAGTAGQLELLTTLSAHSDRVYTLAFSGDGSQIASVSPDKTIKVWDVASGQAVHTFAIGEVGMNDIAFSPAGRLLASWEAIWDVESKQVVHTLDRARFGPVAFSPDGSILAVAYFERPIKLWDVASGQVVRTLDDQAGNLALSIEFSPDGALVAVGGHLNGTVTLWDVETGQIVRTLAHDTKSNFHGVAFSPDGQLLASTATAGTTKLWEVATGELAHTLTRGNGCYDVTFSPDGSLLATAGCDRTVMLWDAGTWQLVRTLPHAEPVMSVVFSPDGTRLASGGYDQQIYLWGIPR